ncbi:hypothetical protein CMQ_8308 [Grosmannia clavigera kw1407]|uniref:FAM192A/Fyv6 N-terminal domain-containing protein n=1 Tax=Grosmannia clavigera (strain kw1407 / UAMH 11150) TaxID=655863 RepID=F0XL39_GROCL|nr:uncharacterized protein CMQ_8308 [Grosmannia clavigera kw1407]EFX01842.1 hypothetical protein CMQ_8308 [Grosmannia clavigera kw1407]
MSSRFVSGGAIDSSSGEAVALGTSPETKKHDSQVPTRHNTEWEAVERELQERRKRATAKQAAGVSDGEKSLYDVLEANKAAKQAAFDEAHRLKNQFRPLDEDEVDFLDSILASSRAEEERVRRETQEGLDKFREEQQRQETPRDRDTVGIVDNYVSTNAAGLLHEGGWHVSNAAGSRKRKRREDKAGPFMGLRRKGVASADAKQDREQKSEATTHKSDCERGQLGGKVPQRRSNKNNLEDGSPVEVPKAKLALVDYGSDGEISGGD